MAGLLDLDLVAARDALRARTISSTELTSAYLARIEATRELNAYITVTAHKALAMATAADERRARGEGGGLAGVPSRITDRHCPEGVPASAPTHHPPGCRPTYEGNGTATLRDAGGDVPAKPTKNEHRRCQRN